MDTSEFWDRVNALIKERGTTQSAVSVSCGLNPRRIQNLSSGSRLPDVFEGFLIARCLGTSVEYLVTGREEEVPRDVLNAAHEISALPAMLRNVVLATLESCKGQQSGRELENPSAAV